MILAGVVGASGYIGGELLRLLLGHPDVQLVAATSTRLAGKRVDGNHPNLRSATDAVYMAPESLPECDVLFAATPGTPVDLLRRAPVVYDLSPDLRLADPAIYRHYYGDDPPAPELLGSAVPGWPERHRERLAKADLVSMPGCMANASILALHPLVEHGLIETAVTIDGRVGSSGSGATAGAMNVHAERSGAWRVFAPWGHRHEAEIAQATGLSVSMSGTGMPSVRGVQVLCRVQAHPGVDEQAVRAAYRAHYAAEPFVRVVAQRRGTYRYPEPKILAGTNFCDVGFSLDPETGQLIIIAALDNLTKGGAGNAVQCLNIRMGRPERAGLGFFGLHPV
jgi:LysW-gamma-L-alpha-aminoadipyl-6-phosphate/LysW-L-glutamyl-5-phosphate reductase